MRNSSVLSDTAIREVIERLVQAADPVRVVLFGSYAQGNPAPDSDLDILVVQREVASASREMARLRRVVGPVGVGVDLLVCSEQDVEDWGGLPGTVLYVALQEGKVLYEKPR